MELVIPNNIIQLAIDAHQLQLTGQKTLEFDEQWSDVQRLQYHIGEMVCALVIKEYIRK